MRALLFLLLAFASGCGRAHTVQDVALRLSFEGGGLCSGTSVGRDVVLTAAHCFEHGRLVGINGHEAYALRIARDGKDHVLVKVTQTFRHWARIGGMPVQAQRLRFVGNPAGEANMYREGYVVRAQTDGVLVDARSFNGDSGAGLLDDQGRVVAVLSGAYLWRNGQFVMQLVACLPLNFTHEQYAEMT